jgi:hypothetical protein
MELDHIILSKVSQVQKDKVACLLHMWKIGPNTNTSIIIYTNMYAEHVSNSGTTREARGGEKRKRMIE